VFSFNSNHTQGVAMNKSELVNSLSEETTFSKKDVSRVLDSLTRIIERTLRKGEKVSITGFGSFWLSRRPARKGINPATKQRIDLPAVNVPRFKAGKNLRDVVRSLR
jgi:DNA-binding protein HU-beta